MQHSIGSADKRSKESYKIKIKSEISSETLEIELFSWTTIHVLKEMIQRKTGIKLKDQRLYLDNQELIRHNQNMFDYNISRFFLNFLFFPSFFIFFLFIHKFPFLY